MPNTMGKSIPIVFRLSVEAYKIVKRRADKQGKSVGQYYKDRAEYDIKRKHGKSNP